MWKIDAESSCDAWFIKLKETESVNKALEIEKPVYDQITNIIQHIL